MGKGELDILEYNVPVAQFHNYDGLVSQIACN
jgi:hypothetical protein